MLVLAPDNPEAHLNDFDFAGMIARHAGVHVVRLDPEKAYSAGGIAGLEREVERELREQAIDVLVYALGTEFDFDPRFFGNLSGVYRILELGDDEHYFEPLHRYYAPFFDLVLTTNPECERYRPLGVEPIFQPGVFSSAVFNPGTERRKDYDVSFIGAMDKVGRERYATALSRAGIEVRLFGAGTRAGIVTQDQVVEIYRRSRINLNFTGGALRTPLERDPAVNRNVRQVKGRMSKIALCGSFVLSEDAPGIARLFKVGEEIDVFHDEQQLVEKVRFYLAHEAQREAMATRAHARALADYDEARFWPQLVRTIERLARPERPARKPTALDWTFWSGFGAWRFKYFVVFLFAGRIGLLARELGLLLRVGRFKPSAALWFAAMGLAAAERSSRGAAALRRWIRSSRRFLHA
jgi:spore maturation protein CgeB